MSFSSQMQAWCWIASGDLCQQISDQHASHSSPGCKLSRVHTAPWAWRLEALLPPRINNLCAVSALCLTCSLSCSSSGTLSCPTSAQVMLTSMAPHLPAC